jgi:hypothetical protein
MKHIDFPLQITNYPKFIKYEKLLRFYEEIEHCSKELKKLIDIVHIFCISSHNLNEITQRNYSIIKLNFNFLLGLFNLFKFNQSLPVQRLLIKIYLIKLVAFVIEEFGNLRKKFKNFFYFSKEEEKRFLEALRVMVKNSEEGGNLFPSKMGFFYLRQVRFYIFKVNKYIFRNDSDKTQHKLSYYVSLKPITIYLECQVQFFMHSFLKLFDCKRRKLI